MAFNETGRVALNNTGHVFQEPLLKTSFAVAMIYCIITGLVILIGTVGNVTIVVVLIRKRKVNKIGRIFMINLALADLCIAAIAEPMCLAGVILGEEWFSENWVVCEAVSMLCFTACMCSFLSFVFQSFNRYLYICHIKWYHVIYSTRRCVVICICCWIFGLAADMTNFVGWGDHGFDLKNNKCSWSRTVSFSYTLFITVSNVSLFALVGISFVLIFRKIAKCKMDLHKLNVDDPSRNRTARSEALRSSRTLLASFFMFIICWTPYSLLIILDFADTARQEIYMFLTLLAHVHACSNFCIYIACNRTFRSNLRSSFLK